MNKGNRGSRIAILAILIGLLLLLGVLVSKIDLNALFGTGPYTRGQFES